MNDLLCEGKIDICKLYRPTLYTHYRYSRLEKILAIVELLQERVMVTTDRVCVVGAWINSERSQYCRV